MRSASQAQIVKADVSGGAENRYHFGFFATICAMTQSADALNRFIGHSEQLLEVAELLARENAQLKIRLAQSQAQTINLEKRLSAARARIEALIARLPENEMLSPLPDNS